MKMASAEAQTSDNKVTEENSVTPDSTTTDRLVFSVGEDVLYHREDGLFYFGTIVEVQTTEEKCLVQFGDSTETWAHYRDLRKVKVQTSISCILCKTSQSNSDNQILICHYCRRGYHQTCHDPVIPATFSSHDTHWMCTRCGESRQKSSPVKGMNRRSLPYDPSSLKWDVNHQTNEEGKYCYCGQDGEWFRRMLKCCQCAQWFHNDCTSTVAKDLMLYGDRFFLFMCSVCGKGEERIRRLTEEQSLADIAHLTLYNLMMTTGYKFHELDQTIIPFIEEHWKYFDPSPEITSMEPSERRINILASFCQFKNRFTCGREVKKKQTTWGLRDRVPPPFPAELSPLSRRTLELWTNSKITVPPGKKRTTRASLDPELQRKLRVRQSQARIVSEESVCEESSDDLKATSFKNGKKRKWGAGSSSTSSSVTSGQLTTPTESSSDERGTLELFIPPPRDFRGPNNPFSNFDQEEHSMNPYLTTVRPLKTKLSEKDIRITKTGEIKRKRFVRKWKRSQEGLFQLSEPSGFSTYSIGQPTSCKSSKESVMSYFGVQERIARGEKYVVHAKRVGPDGRLQYLIQWEADA